MKHNFSDVIWQIFFLNRSTDNYAKMMFYFSFKITFRSALELKLFHITLTHLICKISLFFLYKKKVKYAHHRIF